MCMDNDWGADVIPVWQYGRKKRAALSQSRMSVTPMWIQAHEKHIYRSPMKGWKEVCIIKINRNKDKDLF